MLSIIGHCSAEELLRLSTAELQCLEQRAALHFPNNYTYTKLLAETVDDWAAQRKSWSNDKTMSLNIVRPTIISAAVSFPYPDFVSSEVGSCAVIGMYARGLLRRFVYAWDHVLDLVFVDKAAKVVVLAGLLNSTYVDDKTSKYGTQNKDRNKINKFVMHIWSTAQ